MTFPATPFTGQTFSEDGVTYTWRGDYLGWTKTVMGPDNNPIYIPIHYINQELLVSRLVELEAWRNELEISGLLLLETE